ncbi:hypothetical protein [Haloarchaeobius amylolyticus]|uniref:hypothetical protein n=1 Tax=Haloarchaeobius amylolyticus TaxID=1198296 RepID=UPI00226F661E|nr:hypothetical protein [Haloarchaeobius amylolyticus]
MFQTRWEDVKGRQLRYNGHTWELTGDVGIEDSGATLVVEARAVDDVKGEQARLCFDIAGAPASLNPGQDGERFHLLERRPEGHVLVVKDAGRTYRYVLHRIEYL